MKSKKKPEPEEKYPELVEAIEEATGYKLEKEYLLYQNRPRNSKGNFSFDYALPEHKVAIEVEGGLLGFKDKDGKLQTKGGHSSIRGIHRDIKKYNSATVNGWRLLRITSQQARCRKKGQQYIIELINALLWKN